MTVIHGFEKLREQKIRELNTRAEIYRHGTTGAQLLSLINEDENKVFGITFRTPPFDSTGVAHILEHSVLCGSRKYPVKEPFVELLKGSLQTFLNAMTYPDKTCYPVASQNVQDFYNLIDIYLDAVFYPRLTPFVLQQEGWHYELENPEGPMTYKGVVFNEMKGAYSSPDSLLAEYSQQSLFPDNAYALDSGGNPKRIPDLTFEAFKAFHERYYHPSNARIYFYGDDDPERRLLLVHEYLKDFQRMDIDSQVPLQPSFEKPRSLTRAFAAGQEGGQGPKGMITLNWLLEETIRSEVNLAFNMLAYILLGMPGSPLRKALIDSDYGEDVTGEGLGGELRQMYFSTGLKGIDPKNAGKVEALILDTLEGLVKNGIDPLTVEAALNTIEFSLRENNTGNYPRGLAVMLRALTTWLYDEDPLALVAFEAPLEAVKSQIAGNNSYFEKMIDRFLIRNPHRTTLLLSPDPELTKREEAEEREKLAGVLNAMDHEALGGVMRNAERLKEMQEAPDPPEALAAIPSLNLTDLDKENKLIPLALRQEKDTRILYHDLFTNRIAYTDAGFNLRALPRKILPYVRLFARALLEMGTEAEDFVSLSQRISSKTGGIYPAYFTSAVQGDQGGATWMFLRGKAMTDRTGELFDILRDVLLNVHLDNRTRFRQMVLEAKAREEQKLIPAGHQMVNLRLRAHFNDADWAAEQMTGISYLFFLRRLTEAIEEDWPGVLKDLREMHRILVNRNAMTLNITLDQTGWSEVKPRLGEFLDALPSGPVRPVTWSPGRLPDFEGLTIPAQVNYVGKGASLYPTGYQHHGSAHVITRYLRNSWLWDRIRVRGGAYGAFCIFDRLSGILSFVSYRDPNLTGTLEAFDESARFLREMDLNETELAKSIIGTIGDIDQYRLPDAKGYLSMVRYLTGESDDDRRRLREEVLQTTPKDFKAFAEVLEAVKENGLVKILGSESAIEKSLSERPGWLKVTKVL